MCTHIHSTYTYIRMLLVWVYCMYTLCGGLYLSGRVIESDIPHTLIYTYPVDGVHTSTRVYIMSHHVCHDTRRYIIHILGSTCTTYILLTRGATWCTCIPVVHKTYGDLQLVYPKYTHPVDGTDGMRYIHMRCLDIYIRTHVRTYVIRSTTSYCVCLRSLYSTEW